MRALDDVSLSLGRGEVLALIGENGAGKSTLIRVLSGAVAPDSGRVKMDGRDVELASPTAARACGISTIFQELNIINYPSAAENVFLGREIGRYGFLNIGEMYSRARALLERVGADVPLTCEARRLSVAQKQLIEIARALAVESRVVIMDEPTATLSEPEVERLFEVVRRLTASGVSVLYVSHRLRGAV